MHEASIAQSILDVIIDKCSAEGYHVIDSVKVRIGRAAGIMPEALLFAFDVAKSDTPASEALLIIERVPLGGFCRDCGAEFETEETYVLQCPSCGSTAFRMERGYEMEIAEMEVN